jgi:hypothetical protein
MMGMDAPARLDCSDCSGRGPHAFFIVTRCDGAPSPHIGLIDKEVRVVNDLVKRLSEGSHPVEVSLRPERTMKLFREMLDRGHVLVKFTQTRGGTELGFPLDKTRSDLTQADLTAETGKIRVCGELTLDYVPVRVVADIDLPSLEGQGHLEILGEERAA